LTALMAGRRSAVSGRARLAEADGRAQSPLETRIRLIASDVGFPADTLQLPVVDRQGHLLGYGDLAWFRPGRRMLIAECDGASVHTAPAAVLRDRYRSNDFITRGEVDIVRFTWRDAEQPTYVRS